VDKIRRLRALEKKFQDEASNARATFKNGGGEYYDGRSDAFNLAASELATLIAELGQEVGAVPNGKLVGWWNGITPGFDGMGVPSIRWGADAENSGHDIPLYDGYNPIHYVTPPSSPAHTSEARDAVVKGVRELAIKATAHWDAKFDDAALDVARRFTLDTEPQRRASLQVAIVEAMHRASNRSQS
jgi:hypothetical protein